MRLRCQCDKRRTTRTALYHPGDRQGPGRNEITLASLYDIFWHPGALETVKANLLKYSKAVLRVKAKAKKIKVKKLKCSELHETQEFWIKKFSPYKSLSWTWALSRPQATKTPTMSQKWSKWASWKMENTHHVPKMVQIGFMTPNRLS